MRFKTIHDWVSFEVTCFYAYIVSAVMFLLYIQFRGTFSISHRSYNDKRYMYDPLEYYQRDINWFSLSFILAYLHGKVLF
jgi:hypothetical protein